MNTVFKLLLIVGFMVAYDLAVAVPNCPPSNGNVDIFTRIIDYRSQPGEASEDFKKTIAAMGSGGNGKLTGICVEAHSNVPNSIISTAEEAKRFATKICRANLIHGVPIYVHGYGNEIPSLDYWIYKDEPNENIFNHRVIVRYVYRCPAGLSCVSPLSGVVLNDHNRVAFGAGVCVEKVAKGTTLRSEAALTADKTEYSAREMLATVREMLSKGITSAAQQKQVSDLQGQAEQALALVKDIRNNLEEIPNVALKPNCPE